MLKAAIPHKEEVSLIHSCTWDIPKYKYYHIGYCSTPEIDIDEWNKVQRVCIADDVVIGYFSASVNRTCRIITGISVISIAKTYRQYKIFEKDLLKFFLILLEKYPTIQWCVCVNNPVRKKYEKFCEVVGGNIVGTYHKSSLVQNNLEDEEVFELLSTPETISKVKSLMERINIKEKKDD